MVGFEELREEDTGATCEPREGCDGDGSHADRELDSVAFGASEGTVASSTNVI